MQLRTVLLFLATLLPALAVYSQVKITSLQLGRVNTWLSYSFPLVQSSNKQIAQRINLFLQKEILDNDSVLMDTNTVFEKSRYINNDTVSQSGLSEVNYTVEVNNSRVLSFVFQLEGTGAYSEYYQAYYNFNSQTGLVLSAKDLFTPAGIVEIRRILQTERKKLISAWIEEVDTSYSNNRDELEYIEETFKRCNVDPDENNFLIKEKNIVFCRGYCFPHVARPYDTDLDVELGFDEIGKFLSSNGRKLLLQKR